MTTMRARGTEPVVELRKVSKTFGATVALAGADLALHRGEVHGLVGQNGSGKSTLVKILSGYHRPDAGGEVIARGTRLRLPMAPGESRTRGFAFVHQDLGLIDSLSVLENLRVGRYVAGGPRPISWRRERETAVRMLDRFGISVGLGTRIAHLSQVDRAVVAIVRALQDLDTLDSGLLVVDEPTAYLPRDSAERFFELVRTVAGEGHAVLFVSHQLAEITSLTDRVTVLRDSRVVASARTTEFTEEQLIELILGRTLEELYPTRAQPSETNPVLSVRHLSGRVVDDLSLELRPAEIVGITGLAGSGVEEVPYLLTGAQRPTGGTADLAGITMSVSEFSPPRTRAAGFALVPGDRARQGLAPALSVHDNLAQPIIGDNFAGLRLRLGHVRAAVEKLVRGFDIKPADPRRPIWKLSGGNQQKVMLAKWYQVKPRVLVLHEPTAGVDVGSRQQIFELISNAAAERCAILIATGEYDDLAHLCDRVLILRNGRLVKELTAPGLTGERVIEHCYRAAPSDTTPSFNAAK